MTGDLRVPFDRRGLRPLVVAGAFFAVAGAAMTVDDYVFLGATVPKPLRVLLGVAAVVLGLFLLVSALRRARSDEPAIEVVGSSLRRHVNPGRRLTLDRSQVLGVSEVRPVPQAIRRAIVGDAFFEIRTTLPEGVRASTVLVGSRFLAQGLRACRTALVEALEL